ncbi:hypothetical protein RvY_12845 [Ramazzottius varieornatus]|uniref:Uncharacterized protein n=1 Tax=Ramazzottius varieornatus TaxID=947166 RepID=A0A1D1VTF8_RAMVA|nr:hypothetical protein RvY_12845 [Ramazzottius varieornatus]
MTPGSDSSTSILGFLEINRQTLGRYAELIRRCLENSVFVTLAVHCNWDHDPPHFRSTETISDFFIRCSTLSLSHEIHSLGLSCVSLVPQNESGTSELVAVKNFNIATCTMQSSIHSGASLLQARKRGYDLNYLASEGCSYYRGRDARAKNSEECHALRLIFQQLHGNELNASLLRPVVLAGGGLPSLIAAYSALSGLPGENLTEFLQRIHGLFPGKLLDGALIRSDEARKEKTTEVPALSFTTDEVDIEDFLRFTDMKADGNLKSFLSQPNRFHPAALDSLHAAQKVLKTPVDAEGKFSRSALTDLVKNHGNLLSAPGSSEVVKILPAASATFNPSKKKQIE